MSSINSIKKCYYSGDFNEAHRRCDESCIFREIVPDTIRGYHTGYFKLRCLLFDVLPLFMYCPLDMDDYYEYYRYFTVVNGELKEKFELL